jgi:6,7-dimethyl-8-ribityllumazine synthase
MALDPHPSTRARPSRPESVIGIAVARFHSELTGPMKDSAMRELEACGVDPDDIHVVWVPGAFELPLAARRLVQNMEVEAVLCLGVVLKGETEHDHWVAHGAVTGIMDVCLEEDLPVMLGVLTCETIEQARARALPALEGVRETAHFQDKGREIARAAIETLIALDDVEEGETGGEGAGAHDLEGAGAQEDET